MLFLSLGILLVESISELIVRQTQYDMPNALSPLEVSRPSKSPVVMFAKSCWINVSQSAGSAPPPAIFGDNRLNPAVVGLEFTV